MMLPAIPPTTLHAKIVGGISDLRNAVSIISEVAGNGNAKVIMTDDWSYFQVVKQQGHGVFIAELRLLGKGCHHYEFKLDSGDWRVCNYDINNLASLQRFLMQATEQDGFSITYNSYHGMAKRLALFHNSDLLNANSQVGEGQATSSMPSTVEKRPLSDIAADDSASSEKVKKKEKQYQGGPETYFDKQTHKPSVLGEGSESSTATAERTFIEMALYPPTGLHDPPMADETSYRVTVTIPSESLFNILKKR